MEEVDDGAAEDDTKESYNCQYRALKIMKQFKNSVSLN